MKRGVRIDLVPWNHPLNVDEYDGLFLSNGPGDPTKCMETIDNIKKVLSAKIKPIFGICLGHQLLSLAAGCKSFKMKWVVYHISLSWLYFAVYDFIKIKQQTKVLYNEAYI